MTGWLSIPNRILNNALVWPEAPAMLMADQIVTYRMLAGGMLSAQHRIARLGLHPARPLAIEVAHPARHMILALAAMRLGIASASLAPGDGSAGRLGCQAVLADDADASRGLRVLPVDGDWFTGEQAGLRETPPDATALCRISLTSGTTGQPKPLAQSELVLWRRIEERLTLPVTTTSRTLCLPGLTTNFGFSRSLLPLCLGDTTVFAGTYEETARLIDLYKVEHLIGSPAQLLALIDGVRAAQVSMSSLRLVKSGGGPLGPALVAKLRADLCPNLVDVYSSTEAGPAGFAAGHFLLSRQDELSFIPSIPVRSVDESGAPTEDTGLIEVRSHARAIPYRPGQPYVMPETAWVRTGDVGRIHPSGELRVLGRAGSVLNAGGRKFDAEAMQQFLTAQPGIDDAGVVVSDGDTHGAEVWIALVCSTTPDVARICAGLSGAFNGFRPERIVRFDKLPRNTLGKLQGDELRTMIRQSAH
jgi:acyl-coenzyme A synthetase/AMP-(fatty) acid ligase